MATFSQERGDAVAARAWARKLIALEPQDSDAWGLLRALEFERK